MPSARRFSGALDLISSLWNSVCIEVSSFVSSTWENVKSTVSDGIEGMMGFIQDIPGRIKGFFSDAGSWLVDAGRSIIDGLVNGIRNAIGGAVDAVSGAVGEIRALFPFSPAKKGPFSGHGWVLYSGMSIADALAEGFERRVPSMVAAYGSGMAAVSSPRSPRAPRPTGRTTRARANTGRRSNIYQPVKSPSELAREMRRQQRYGLAASRGAPMAWREYVDLRIVRDDGEELRMSTGRSRAGSCPPAPWTASRSWT